MGELIEFASNGDSAQGHLAGSGGPGIVLLQEWWGLVPHIVDVAERLAVEGFVVLAPDLYHGETTTEPDEAAKRLMALDFDRAARDIKGAADYLASRDDVTGDRLGAIGFCMGGSLALWSAAISERVVATVPFYPAIPPEKLSADWSAYAGKATLMHLAEGDGGSASQPVQAAAQAVRDAGGEVTLHDYPGTEHAFFNDSRPEVHDLAAAELAWSRTLAFLRERLAR